jgi:hypothetical protein
MSTGDLASGWAKALGGDRKQFDMFFDRMLDAFAYHKIVVDKTGKPVDYVFLEVNHAFERMTGLKRERIIGKKVTEVLPGIEKDPADWIGVYGKVALTCQPAQFENHAEPLDRWYRVSAYCPEKGYFVALFEDITQRRKVEKELWRANNDWERTFDSVPDLIAILDNHHKILRVNRAMAKQLGVTPEKAVGLDCFTCVHGAIEPPEFCPHSKSVKDGKEHIAEVHEPRLGGDFLVSTTPLLNEKGCMVGSVHVARNVTERKKAEEEVERIASFPLLNPNPVLEVNFNGTITYCNPATKKKFADLETLGMAHPLLSDWQNVVKALQNKYPGALHREVKAGEQWLYQELFLVPNTERIRIYTIDITERKEAEEALKQSKEIEAARRKEMEALMEAVPATIWITHDRECLNMTGNKATYDLLGLPKSANVSETAPLDQRPTNFCAYNEQGKPIPTEDLPMQVVARTGVALSNSEFEFRFEDGRSVWVHGNVMPLLDSKGNLQGAVAAYVDITERKKA